MMKWIIVALVGLNGYLVAEADLVFMGRIAWAEAIGAVPPLVTVPLKTTGDGTAFVNASITNTDVRFRALVDTGASTTLLPYEIYVKLTRLKLVRKTGEATYLMADGRKVRLDEAVLSGLVLGGSCNLDDIDIAVAPKGKPHALLGMNVMSQWTPFSHYGDSIKFYDWRNSCNLEEGA